MDSMPHLIPVPASIDLTGGSLHLPRPAAIIAEAAIVHDARLALQQLATAMAASCGHRGEISTAVDHPQAAIRCSIDPALPAQGYRLQIDRAVTLVGADLAGLNHGVQTLIQLLRQAGAALPRLVIDDAPDFPVRGFYHDATRGKVATLATYKALADRCQAYKLNQLQLYVEHTFAFSWMPDLWAGADPLTAEEIIELDAYCAERHIELVPSLSCFGHSYTLIRTLRHEHLNELEVAASELPHSLWDRMGHYTLDALNEESWQLVGRMIAEFAPLFRSRLFNICCDETFDLGKGKHVEQAAGDGLSRLYIDFVNHVIDAVHAAGRTPMLWGDILHKHPEHVDQLPGDAIVLDWGYSPEMNEERTRQFAASGRTFYVCPGCQTWYHFLPDIDTASLNINRFARLGHRHGAMGLLNTDWGDLGHVSFLGNSWHGLAYGAACSWRVPDDDEAAHLARFDAAFSRLEIGDDGQVLRLLRALGANKPCRWNGLAFEMDPSTFMGEDWRSPVTGICDSIIKLDAEAVLASHQCIVEQRRALEAALVAAHPVDPCFATEVALGAWGLEVVAEAHHLLQRADARLRGEPTAVPASELTFAATADGLRRFENAFTQAWHARNKPSEAFRIRQIILDLANRLDRFDRQLQA